MDSLCPDDTLWLLNAASGKHGAAFCDDTLRCMEAAGHIQVLSDDDIHAIEDHRELAAECQAARDRVVVAGRRGVLESVRHLVDKRRRIERDTHLEQLNREMTDICDRGRASWATVSARKLTELDLYTYVEMPSCRIRVSDSTRALVRDYLRSEEFERDVVDAGRLSEYVERYADIYWYLRNSGYPGDPRVDLTAALFCRMNRPIRDLQEMICSVGEAWHSESFDRLPLAACLCDRTVSEKLCPIGIEEQRADDICRSFYACYENICIADYPRGCCTRYMTLNMLRGQSVDAAALEKVTTLAAKLRYNGWAMGRKTNVTAARLSTLYLGPYRIAGRVDEVTTELSKMFRLVGSYELLGASILVDSNLHPVSDNTGAGALPMASGVYNRYMQSFAVLWSRARAGRTMAHRETAALLAALLAAVPGTIEGTWARYMDTVGAIEGSTEHGNEHSVAVCLLDTAFPEWFDSSRFVWEILALSNITKATSAFSGAGW